MRAPLAATAAAAIVAVAGCTGGGSSTGSQALCRPTVRTPQFGSASDLVVQDLGTFDVNTLVTFTVPAGTTSFSIVSQEVAGSAASAVVVWDPTEKRNVIVPNVVVPNQVKMPDGTIYYDDVALDAPDVVYWGGSSVAGTFTAPNTSAGVDAVLASSELPSGTWSFLANDWANECAHFTGLCAAPIPPNTGRYRLYAVTKSGGLASSGTLDVEVYLLLDPTNPISTAESANGASQIQRWKSSLGWYLAKGGVTLGTVTFHDLPASVHQRYPSGSVDVTNPSPCAPLAQLFTTSSAPGRAVSLFLVEELVDHSQSTSGTITVGIDGTIPGPSGFPGTVGSGAAVGLFGELGSGTCPGAGAPSLANCGTDRLAYVAAHEIGHWLGLYHVTEDDGANFDPLTDTSQCPASCAGTGGPGSGGVTVSECLSGPSCGGGDNLMFWLLDNRYSVGNLSPDQGRVMRLNPAVR
jgi:hypothetical protein